MERAANISRHRDPREYSALPGITYKLPSTFIFAVSTSPSLLSSSTSRLHRPAPTTPCFEIIPPPQLFNSNDLTGEKLIFEKNTRAAASFRSTFVGRYFQTCNEFKACINDVSRGIFLPLLIKTFMCTWYTVLGFPIDSIMQ